MHKKIFYILSILVVASMLVAACGGAATPAPTEVQVVTEAPAATEAPTQPPAATEAPTQPPAATAAPTTAPATGEVDLTKCIKVANVEVSGEKLNLDPMNQPSTENSIMVEQVYDRLLDLDSDFVVHPELAEKWESNADATVWTFHLVHGVKFHDGTELKAKDVVYTFKRLIDPASGSEAAATMAFLNPAGITAVDDYTVEFKTDKPVVELPVLITGKNSYIIQDGATADTLNYKPNGTGPYMPVNFEPNAQPHVFVKNPNYWVPGLPKADCVAFYAIQEATTRNASLLSGEVDLVQLVDYATIPTLKDNPAVKLMTTKAATSYVLAMWVDTAPFDKPQVRKAMKMAIDRQAMLDTVLLGYGEIGDDNPVPPTSPYAWRTEVPKQDLEGAKKLLAEVGYGPDKPLKVDFYTADYIPGAVALAQVFKEQVAQVGIEVNVIVGPASEHWDNIWLKQSFVGSGWNARHPGEGLAIAYRSNAQYPETHWYRKDYDALLDAANTEADAAKRMDLYKQAEKMLTEEGGAIIPLFQHSVVAMRAQCDGYTPYAQLYKLDLRYITCTK